jgi:hypothetical protein
LKLGNPTIGAVANSDFESGGTFTSVALNMADRGRRDGALHLFNTPTSRFNAGGTRGNSRGNQVVFPELSASSMTSAVSQLRIEAASIPTNHVQSIIVYPITSLNPGVPEVMEAIACGFIEDLRALESAVSSEVNVA